MSKKITLENVDSSELPEIPVIGEVKQIRFTQDMELVSTLADSDLFMIQAGADLEARPNTITFDLIIKNLSGPIEEGSKKFVTGDMMFKVIGDMNLLDTWDNTNLVSSLNATYVNVRRIEEELRREINRSTGKDDLHDTQIANLRQDLTSTNEMLNQEINRSVAKDNEHDELLEGLRDDVDSTSAKLDAEIDRSTAKDAEHDTLLKGLRVDVNANKSAIDSEVARSTARDEAHDAAISKNASDIATETSRAKAEEAKIRQEMQAADTNLQNAITAETERATGVEEDLQRQITDLSGSTDDRLEALEALSHEQNTDTGTTSKTFVIDSGNTGAMLKAEGGGLSTRTKGDAGYANFTVQNLVIKGDVTQEGDTFITQAERVEVRDNMILINEGETGAGVTAGFAGIEVDRGTEQNFMFGFNESDGMFKIGKEGDMFDVALRQPVGDMIDGMFASWDAATKTFKTTNVIPYNKSLDFKFDPEIVDATLKMKFMEAGLGLSMSGDDSILALLPGISQDEVKYSLISTNTNGIILGDSSGSNDKFILDIKKPSFISPVLDKNVIIGGKNAYFSYYSHIMGSPNTIIASCGVTAPSFYRASDNAEVLYSLDQARLTDGMFLSWDATNKMLVANNLVPEGIKLYFGTSSNYIDYYNEDNGYIRFITNTGILRFSTNNNFTIFRSSSNNGFQFIGKIETTYGVLNSLSDNLTIGTKQGNGSIKLYIGESSYITTPFSAVTFKRSSDDSEVLYQADLKSVLTGKETNYAPTVKAVSDAIDAVNTGTTESLKNYLKLSGGTMTGSIIMNNSIVLKSKDNNGVERRLIGKSIEGTTHIGDIDGKAQIYTSDTDVIHFRSTGSYKILDSYNLPDPATKSGNNAFTGTNSFVANKFSVGNFRVDSNSDFGVNTPYREGLEGLSRSLYFKYNNLEDTKVSFGSVSSSTVANYAYIGIGSVGHNNAQYKFRTDSLDLNTIFRIDFGDASAILANESTIIFGSNRRGCYVRSNDTDLVHVKNSNSYKIWDASNLPTPASTSDIPDVSDMAKKSEANTFTAQNTFTAGQFNVGPFEVSSTGQLLVNITTSDGWERSITFKANSDNATSIRIGGHGIGSTSNFAWIGVGDVEYDTAQYRFYGTSMKVPSVWSLDDADGNSLIWTQSTQLAHIGRATGTTKIRSGAVDLIHTKGATDYKILDESNYSQYLPTNNKWTYGFVVTYIEGSNADFNTLFAGPDSPKIVFNYYRPIGHNTNAPTGMSYGAVLQIDGNYNSGYNNVALRPQLAFDINHNVENGTRYMWFRTANNLGYGDSSNWKRVVTADENVAVLVMDANTYPSIARIDGTTYNWLRTPAQGLLPNTQATLDSGGTSYLGTNDWSFGYASIHTIYSKRYMFGNTGVDFRLDTNNKIAATISGSARGIEIGDLLVSSNYGEDAAKVPTNGIFSSGIIKSYSGFSSDSRINNLNISKASNDALHISSFAEENVINKPGVDPVSGQSIGDGVALTYFWEGDYAFQLVGDIDGVGMAYRKYTPSTGDSTDWKFLADTKWVNTKLGGYLPLTGGILSGQLIINSISNSLILNNTNSSETESFIKVQLNGTSKAAIGFLSSIGSYIYNYESKKYLFVGTDGAYLGNTISKAKLLTSADLSGYATQTWANSKFAPLSTFKILSGCPAIVNTGNEWILTSNQSGIYINYRTPSDTIIPTTWYWKNGTSTGYANGYWGNLYMVEKLVATQEWVSGRGYLTSITKSMVTSALGYTPPTTSDIPDVSDMAKKSEANTFTAQNTFTAGQFNVGPFEVSSTGQLLVNITTSDGWERSITFKANSDNATSIRIGGHGIGSTSNFAWIGVGDVEYDTAQYRFYGTSMKVPSVWSLDDADGNSLIWTQSTQLAHIGRATGTTKIRSGAVDLIHTKGATDYKILDESNYSQYLPTNNKWTYGFVVTYIEGSNADFNTLFAGPDSPKIVFNYYRPIGHNTNAPTGMSYGAVLQIDGNYNSGYNNVALRPQLAFDINHNVENGTRYMWFRTANNLGYGDSSNWKRVVTADENVAVLVMDANTYPSIARIDGTTYNWLRTPAQGLLPNTQATLDSGGTSYLGTNDWSFGYASIHTIYSKRYMFGNTGVDFRLDTNNKIAATISGSARGIEIGDLLVSSNYGEDAAKVPTNGIFSSGIIKSYSGFSSDSRINNLNISKASNDALHISSFAEENVINKPGVDPVSGQSIGDGVALTYFWEGDYAFQLVGDIDGVGMAYRKYTPSTGDSTDWKFLADTKWVNTKLGGYLPLTGGILSGQLIINSISNSLILNNTNSSETESFIKVQLNGTSKAAIGFLSSIGSYIYNYESKKYLFVGTDGAYLGNTISKAKLLTSADLSGYATQTWANSKFAPLSTFKILSGCPAIVNTGNEWILTSNQSGIYINYRTPSDTIIPTTWYWKNGTSTGYANGYWGNLYMVEKLVATQEWVSGRGYLTSITKSMVTSALGYTPPTTNTTYSQATSSTLGLVKIGATGLAAKNYAVQLNSSGQMYVAVPWTDTNSTYSAATSSTYGLVKIGATGLAAKNYAVQLNSSGQMYVSVPWTDTDTNTHYTTRLYAGASGTAANAAASNPYLKVTDDNTYRNQVRFIGAGATSISSDASGNITITSKDTTYDLSSYLKENDNISKLTNDRAYVRSTSTLRVNDIQVVEGAAGTATGVLYVVLES